MTDIGRRIQECRKMRGFTQDELAELALLNRVTVAKYESGKVEPGIQAVTRIAAALDMSIDELLDTNANEADRQDDDDTWALREQLRRDPNMRILFSAASKASPEHIRAAAAMLKALEPEEFSE